MQSKVKLTKRQVKEDKFTTFMLTTKDQIAENWQFYVIGLVAVVVAVAALTWYMSSRKSGEQAAAAKFSEASLEYQSGNNQVAILGLSQIIDDYGGSTSAESATYLLATIHLNTRNFAEAIRYFEKYLADYADNKLNRAASYAGIATAYEGQGDFTQAAQYFVKAVEEFPGGPLEADYELGAVRNYIALGDFDSAGARLKNLEAKYLGSEAARRAARLLAEKKRS